ncbi:MAG: hypothetical protein GC129_00580 [Proteobacteria bacterium]|nr:hypothetical protein [Pseudomonadota bacterium]
MKRWFFPVLACALVLMVVFAGDVFAGNPSGTGDGTDSIKLTEGLYCSTKALIQGPTGLLVGLAFAALGVWLLIQGRGMGAALTMIVAGSLVTAVPSLIESTMSGLGTLMVQAHISSDNTTFAAPNCPSTAAATPLPPAYEQPDAPVTSTDQDCNAFEDKGCAKPMPMYGF